MHFKKPPTLLAGAILSCVLSFAGASVATPAAHAASSPGTSSAFGTGISYADAYRTFALSSGGATATGNNTLTYGNSQGQSSSGSNGLGSSYYSGWLGQSTHN